MCLVPYINKIISDIFGHTWKEKNVGGGGGSCLNDHVSLYGYPYTWFTNFSML